MKLIYYHREDIGRREFVFSEIFYIPDKNEILFFGRAVISGGHGRCKYSFLDNKEYLDEAKSIESGKVPKKDQISFSNIKTFECLDATIIELIKNAKLVEELNAKVECGIDALLKQVGATKF